jgi:membrane protein DedA with SNARE-associated domain
MLHRYHMAFILIFRFLYGLRTVSPFAIGMSKVSTPRFILLNMVAAAIWATVFTGGGYLLGTVLESLIAKVERVEGYVLGALVVAGLIAWLGHAHLMRRRQAAVAKSDGDPALPPQTERQDDGS